MIARFVLHVLSVIVCVAMCSVSPAVSARPSDAFITPTEHGSSAVDIHGVKHDGAKYGRHMPPWLAQRIRAVAPKYPREDRRRRNQGSGMFRLRLDPQTGRVTEVVVTSSTGFRSLDAAAIEALQNWQWKPGRWKEIHMPVTFTMQSAEDRPINAVPVPPW